MQPHITLVIPTDDKAFWGAILGAAIGTLGALLAALLAVWADRRKTKSEYRLQQLRNYNQQLVKAETDLNELIPILLKNIRLLEKCIGAKEVGNFMMNLPRRMEITTKNVGNFINRQLVNNWLTLALRIKMCDQLIEDFVSAYKEVRELAFNTAVTGNPIDIPLITTHKQQLLDYASSTKSSAENLVSNCLQTLAMLQLHGELLQSKTTRFKDVRTLEHFELDENKVNEKIAELRERFDPKKVLGDD